MSDANPHGSFIWYELMTSDPDAAADFYGAVIGWTTAPFGGDGAPGYRLFQAADGAVAGLMALPVEAAAAGARPGWFGYIAVDDVDACVAAAEAEGGRLYAPPIEMPDVGRFAMLADPQGAAFYVMRGASDAPSAAFAPDQQGHCAWNELSTDDPDAARAFYSRLFGWSDGERLSMGEAGDYQMLDLGGSSFGAVMRRMPDGPPPAWTFYMTVPSIDAAAAKVRAAGGATLHGPSEIPGGDFILIGTDPQGAVFALVGPR